MTNPYTKSDQASAQGEINAMTFFVQQMLNKMNIGTLARVVKVTNDGELSPVGFVDVLPLVNQLDGRNNAVPHVTVFNIPYMRLQGGTNAVILDPKIGDIGIVIFADRDISKVKATKAQANPGSKRRNSMADALYIGGVLNGVPQQYVQFSDAGMTIVSPTAITLRAPSIVLDGPVNASSTVDAAVDVTAAGTSLLLHPHGGVTPGSGQSGPPIPSP